MAAFLQVQRRFNEAEKLVRQRLDASTRRFGSDHDYTLAAKSNLADLLLDEGKLTDAENLARTVLEVRRKNRGKDNLAAIAAEEAVACILQADGKVTLAETELRECLEAYRKSTGQPSFAFARTLYSLGDVLLDESRPQEAEPLLRNCLRFWEQLASDPAWLSGIWDGLNDCLAMQGKVSQIEPLIASAQKLLDSQQRVLGSDNLDVAGTLAILGSMLANANRPTEAQPLLTRCLSIREKRLASNDWKLARTRSMLGGTLTAQGKFAEAETLVVRGYQGLVGTKATPPRRISDALNLVIALYEKWGKPEQAKEWRRKRLAAVP
jgi:tetratricopeptide (TPR) repeat protein